MTDDSTRQPKMRPADYEKQRDNASMGGPSADLDREDMAVIVQKNEVASLTSEGAAPGADAPSDNVNHE